MGMIGALLTMVTSQLIWVNGNGLVNDLRIGYEYGMINGDNSMVD